MLLLNNSPHERVSNFDWGWGHYRICKSKALHAHRGTKEVALYFSDCMVKNNGNNKRKKNKNNDNNKKCILIDVAIPSDKNAFTKVSEKTFQV